MEITIVYYVTVRFYCSYDTVIGCTMCAKARIFLLVDLQDFFQT